MVPDLRRAGTYDEARQRTRGAPPEGFVPVRSATGEGWGQLVPHPRSENGTGGGLMLRSAAKFGVVGVINTVVYYGAYLGARLLVPYFVAHLLALAVAMVASFYFNCYWTFRTRPTWRKFALWPLTNATNYFMITVGVVVLVEWLGVASRIAPLIAAAAAIPVTFLLSRRVLAGRPDPQPGPAQPAAGEGAAPAEASGISPSTERRRRTG
jgi:putative flippase GtrA